ncbi:hypothetical protein SDC9_178231 [bioreactor metagenome]|uniref:Uncharacterized protein n=1 Tax=bioreactor metagenome TaxID=1076179 RepID=A0A645GWM6_9ZZZZ
MDRKRNPVDLRVPGGDDLVQVAQAFGQGLADHRRTRWQVVRVGARGSGHHMRFWLDPVAIVVRPGRLCGFRAEPVWGGSWSTSRRRMVAAGERRDLAMGLRVNHNTGILA